MLVKKRPFSGQLSNFSGRLSGPGGEECQDKDARSQGLQENSRKKDSSTVDQLADGDKLQKTPHIDEFFTLTQNWFVLNAWTGQINCSPVLLILEAARYTFVTKQTDAEYLHKNRGNLQHRGTR